VIFVTSPNVAFGKRSYAGLKEEAARFGREPDGMLLCNLVTPVCAASRAEAEDKMAVIQELPLEIDQLSLLAEALNFDFAAKGLDEELTDAELASFSGIQTIRDRVLGLSGKKNPTVREFMHLSHRGRPDDAIVGGPREVADRLEEMFVERVCDGFVVAATYVPGGYADFVEHVVPELQRRGLYHADYTGATLRENLGLARPEVGAWYHGGTASLRSLPR
jgi:alkanesulfonate monooxygenase SsuD/methylene tetrahydromethanopterin reductase-like flavin-dependent oxidoreductase (luciferase family)